MKKLFFSLFAVMMLAVAAQAQTQEGKPDKAHHKHHKKRDGRKDEVHRRTKGPDENYP